jgi:hypothetical protein
MNTKALRSLALSLLFGSTLTFSSVGLCADDAEHFKYFDEDTYTATIQKEMQAMDKAYKTANNPKALQGDAEKARQEAITLARHILRHINTRSDSVNIKEGGQLSSTEILLSIRVTGHLLDLLAAEHQPHEDAWSYAY